MSRFCVKPSPSACMRSARAHRADETVCFLRILGQVNQEKPQQGLSSLSHKDVWGREIGTNSSSPVSTRKTDHLRSRGFLCARVLTCVCSAAEPDLTNPTRSRWERPLDTIRSFQEAVDRGYRRSYYGAEGGSLRTWGRTRLANGGLL